MQRKNNMENNFSSITFGPVPSRRLGRSLGINNIPTKICTYSCVYCQLGKTIKMQIEQQKFFITEKIVTAVKNKIKKVKEKGESIDYIAYVPNGEPTLDSNLGKEILCLRELGIKIAVITNASLLSKEIVRDHLNNVDWVSSKSK
jgi:wyosine [tRNA(Phe)-imidazoG37] synthetase (radical SAM superfamily)